MCCAGIAERVGGATVGACRCLIEEMLDLADIESTSFEQKRSNSCGDGTKVLEQHMLTELDLLR